MKIVLDAGHGLLTKGKGTPDGSMKEFEFNSYVVYHMAKLLKEYEGVEIVFTHSNDVDVPLAKRTEKANNWKADLFVSVHANAHKNYWNEANGIETFVHNSKPVKSYDLAIEIQKEMLRYTRRQNRGVKTADFHVLRETKCTAVLVECGFMTNKVEASLLKSTEYRELCAKAIVSGIVRYYKLELKENFVTYKITGLKARMKPIIEDLADKGIEIKIQE